MVRIRIRANPDPSVSGVERISKKDPKHWRHWLDPLSNSLTFYGTNTRAGHATTLPRQRDLVFRPKFFFIIALWLYLVWLLHLNTETLTLIRVACQPTRAGNLLIRSWLIHSFAHRSFTHLLICSSLIHSFAHFAQIK